MTERKRTRVSVAAAASVPFQLNYDQDIGPRDDGDRWLMNVQPVVPITHNEDWNLISRTILPLVSQSDIYPGAGSDDRADVDATFLQPFLSYTTPTAWSFTLNTESTYDWEGEQWSVPVNVIVTKVTKVGGQLISLGGGVRYWADGPDSGPEGFGIRLAFTLLFPK